MAPDGPADDEPSPTLRRAARDGVREAPWDAVTVVIALLLLALALPLVLAGVRGHGPAAWLVVVVGSPSWAWPATGSPPGSAGEGQGDPSSRRIHWHGRLRRHRDPAGGPRVRRRAGRWRE